jgi:phage terminase large subunit
VWQYLKYYTANIPGMRYIEGELSAVFPHGGTIKLYGGAHAVERLRGLHLDGAAMDEFPLLNQQTFSSIVRPALADYHGWAVVAGTPIGDANAFYQLKLTAEKDPENWEVFDIPISATAEDALTRAEVEALRRDMSADEFAREMMCSFVTPVAGRILQRKPQRPASRRPRHRGRPGPRRRRHHRLGSRHRRLHRDMAVPGMRR